MKQNISQIRTRARAATLAKKFDTGLALYEQVLRTYPNDEEALLNKGLIYELLGDRDKFSTHTIATFNRFPNHPKFITRMAALEFKSGKALDAFVRLTKLSPKELEFDALMIACAASAALGKEGESTLYALEAIKLRPSDSLAHSNLGGGFLSLGKTNEARMCFETALLLDPENPHANSNLGVILGMERKPLEAIKYAEKALQIHERLANIDDIYKIKFHLSLLYLQVGNIGKGWDYFDYGFKLKDQSGRFPVRRLSKIKWSGEDLAGKVIMIWREQGIGDEIMFYSVVNYLRNVAARVIVECDYRLQSLLSRSFPDCIIRPYLNGDQSHSSQCDYDYHSPVGSAYGLIFSSLDKFNEIKPYIIPCPKKIDHYDRRLGGRTKVTRVGIAWKTGLPTPIRNLHHTRLSDWGGVFNLPNVQFVNLQYGDVSNEILDTENKYNVSLNNWNDIDRKNDFDDMAALMVNLDVIVSTGSAVFQLAGALGVKTLLLAIHTDPYQLGLANQYPHHPATEIFFPEQGASVSSLLDYVIPERIRQLQNAIV